MEETEPLTASFDEYVSNRGRALWRSAFLLTADPHRAEDLVQTALSRTYSNFERIGDVVAFDAYVRKAIHRTFYSWWRRLWNGERPTERLPEDAGGAPDTELRVDVLRALRDLPPRQRSVIVLRFLEDRSIPEVAEILGITEGTVKSASHRGCAALRASVHLAEEEIAR